VSNIKLNCEDGANFITGQFFPLSGQPAAPDYPLVVAIHGGTYSSGYFDVEGYSLLARATAIGVPIMAVNRPCYGDSSSGHSADGSIVSSAAIVNDALGELWNLHGSGSAGIFLIAHSIGGAVSVLIAAMRKNWPLLGIAISGIGVRAPEHVSEQWRSLPAAPSVAIPADVKDLLMYGPEGTWDPAARNAAHRADSIAPRQELLDIVFEWPRLLNDSAPLVNVPVHFRQPEFDNLWVVDDKEVDGFGARFTRAPLVDAQILRATGHNADFHRIGAALQLQQLAFGLNCAALGRRADG
jgi:pimeloyl-ACP methyl ester carboxylesterase